MDSQKKQAIDRLKALLPSNVTFDETTYIDATTKARFIDSEYGDWWTVPRNLRKGCRHPKRSKIGAIRRKTVEQVEADIKAIRPHLTIKKDTYVDTKTECIFIDSEYGEFSAKPVLVTQGKTDHPIRGKQRLRAGRLIHVDEIASRIAKISPHISLRKETYLEIKKQCTFVDSEYGEWVTTPDNVLSGCQHPSRANHNRSNIMVLSADEIELKVKAVSPFVSLVKSTYINTHKNATWVDEKYGEWIATATNILKGKCHPSRFANISRGEIEVRDYIQSITASPITFNSRILNNHEIDIYLPDLKIGIEYNGVYWHSEKIIEPSYHQNKLSIAKSKNITLIQINSDEWFFKQDIVKSIIKSKLGLAENKYQARKLIIKKVDKDQAQSFLKANHLMGEYKSAKHLGLFTKDNELVSLISYKKHKTGIDISRFCNKLYTSVAGGLSRLLKEIERQEAPDFIQSWVDLRYGTGDSLLAVGFKHAKTTLGWKWTDGINTFNRLRCRANMDERKLSEKAHATELNWYKLYDAGQALFVKEYVY